VTAVDGGLAMSLPLKGCRRRRKHDCGEVAVEDKPLTWAFLVEGYFGGARSSGHDIWRIFMGDH